MPLEASSPARPDTKGADMLVPLILSYPPELLVESMFIPGAARSTQSPRLEKRASPPFALVALTAITFEYAAGYRGTFVPSLPAAATTTTSRPYARLTAVLSTLEFADPPSERFTTSAPWFTLQLMPSTIRESVVNPVAPMTLAMSSLQLKHPPAMPSPLSVSAPAMPVTWVPCPLSSSATASPSTKSL